MRWIYISPHFDDAVLSCGGLIWEQTRQGIPVEIWTVCAGDAPAGELSALAQVVHAGWNLPTSAEVLAVRRQEDRTAAAILGASVRHFDIPDCIYRRSLQGEGLYPLSLNVPVHPSETGLDLHIAQCLKQELLSSDILVCPLAIGGHVDHILIRFAVGSLGLPLLYYADVPYALDHPESLQAASPDFRTRAYPLSDQGMEAWQSAVAAYATQVPVLFNGEEHMRQALRAYRDANSGFYLWQVAGLPG